jgi:transposase
MDWLLEIREKLERQVFDRAAELLGLEVDLLFFDTTSTYFVTEEADQPAARDQRGNPVPDGAEGREAGFRTWGKSKDHRDDLPQIVIGMAVTRDGIPLGSGAGPGTLATPP